jgi:hypothetical protein
MDSDRINSGIYYRVARGEDSAASPGLLHPPPHTQRRRLGGQREHWESESFCRPQKHQPPVTPSNDAGNQSTVDTVEYNLPLLDVSADVNVVATTSRTVLTQVFLNNSKKSISEATYSFPLYDGSTVVSFRCRIGNNVIEGVVKAKDEARAEYKSAICNKKVATLLEQK